MAQKLNREMIEYIAALSKLELTEKELEQSGEEMQKILDYVEKLNMLETDGTEPATHLLVQENCFREDEVSSGDPHRRMLENAPKTEKGQYQVPRTVE